MLVVNIQEELIMSSVIACPNCGQKNRVEVSTNGAICAKCWTKLSASSSPVQAPPPPQDQYKAPPKANPPQTGRRDQYLWIKLLVIGGIVWWALYQAFIGTDSSGIAEKNYSSFEPSTLQPEMQMPKNGSIQLFSQRVRLAPFEIRTSQGANYFVKLVSIDSGQSEMTIFVRGGNTVTTDVPLGTYEVKYASGKNWYGPDHLFGSETSYSKADTHLKFENSGGQISGYTITLYRVANGNMRTKSINPEQF